MNKLFLIIGLILSLSSCKEQDNKELIMGTSADYPPFESMKNGEFIGFEIDLAKAIAQDLGYKLTIKDMDFASLMPALNSNNIDFALAAFTPTPEREKNVDFSKTYLLSKPAIIYKNHNNFKSLEELKDKQIGVQLGSVWEIILKEHNLKILSANRIPQLIEELKLNRIQAFMIDEKQAEDIIKSQVGFSLHALDQYQNGYSIMMKKNSNLKEQFNQALEKLEQSGELTKITNKWFN